MNVHLSVDDVIYSLIELSEKKPQSVFDVGVFKYIKQAHEEYRAIFSLYVFENYAEKFYVNDVPPKYWEELVKSGFVRLGFHGVFSSNDEDIFIKKCANFYETIPMSLRTSCIRLHKYAAGIKEINYLKTYGIRELLCREDESRYIKEFPSSYILSKEEELSMDDDFINRHDITFKKTNIRLEFHDENQVEERILKEINKGNSNIVIFTHEKFLLEEKVSFNNILKILSTYSVNFVFDFQ